MVKSNHNQFAEVNKIQNFLKETNNINTNKKLFTDDLKIMNLWLLNGNKQLSISDGFTNSLSNKDIEFNLVNNLKSFGISSSELGDILSVGIEVDKKILSDLIILNKKNSLKKLKIYNSKYKLVFKGEVYEIYINP